MQMVTRISITNENNNIQESIDLHMQNAKDAVLLLSHQLSQVRDELLDGQLRYNQPGNGHYYNIICGRG